MAGNLGSGGNRQPLNNTSPQAPSRWPTAPKSFTADELKAWEKLKAMCQIANTVAAQDFIAVEYCARVMAKCDKALSDPAIKITTLTALVRLVDSCLKGLGLTPASRRNVSQVSQPEVDDEFSEFQ